MEPIYTMEISVPADFMGDVMGDISTRRGQILGMGAEGTIQKIQAQVPLEELVHYATRLKSLTQGSASFAQKFSHYGEVPKEIQERIVQQNKAL